MPFSALIIEEKNLNFYLMGPHQGISFLGIIYLCPHRLTKMIKNTITTVSTIAVTR